MFVRPNDLSVFFFFWRIWFEQKYKCYLAPEMLPFGSQSNKYTHFISFKSNNSVLNANERELNIKIIIIIIIWNKRDCMTILQSFLVYFKWQSRSAMIHFMMFLTHHFIVFSVLECIWSWDVFRIGNFVQEACSVFIPNGVMWMCAYGKKHSFPNDKCVFVS